MSWQNYADKVKRYFALSRTEWRGFGLLVLVFAFMWSFTQWGTTTFDFQQGLKNFVFALVIVTLSLGMHHAVQRLMGLRYGYRIEHRVWWVGLLAGLLALVLSNGKVLIFAASMMQAHFLPAHRLGAFRYGPSLRQIGAVALTGNIVVVVITFLLSMLFPQQFFTELLSFTLLFALYNMLPIPPLDGLHVFVGARTSYGGSFTYTFTVSAFIGFFLIYYLANIGFIWSLLLAILVGVFGWFAYTVLVEKK